MAALMILEQGGTFQTWPKTKSQKGKIGNVTAKSQANSK